MALKPSDFDELVRDLREAKYRLENCYRITRDGGELALARRYNSYVMNFSGDLGAIDKMKHGRNGKH